MLPRLQDGESMQADHEAVCGIGLWPQLKDGSDATPLPGESATWRVWIGQLSRQQGARIHKAVLISQGFNPETGDLETFVEHCKWAETTDNISRAKFTASDEGSDTKRKKKRLKSKDEDGKKRQKQNSKLYV